MPSSLRASTAPRPANICKRAASTRATARPLRDRPRARQPHQAEARARPTSAKTGSSKPGMLIQPDEGEKASYDRFRGRLMIPIRDARGRVIALRRANPRRGEPKYLNSPGDRPSSTRAAPSTISTSPAPPAAPRHPPHRRRRLYGRDRPRPRRHLRGRRAQRHRGHRSPTRAHVAPRPRRRSSASTATAPGRKAAIRAALPRPPPPRARTNPALRRASGRRGSRRCRSLGWQGSLRSAPRTGPSRSMSAYGATNSIPRPLTTPEPARASRQRLIEHSQAIGDQTLRRLYREQWFRPLRDRDRPPSVPSPARDQRPGQRRAFTVQGAALCSPIRPPATPSPRAIGAGGIDRATARALILGYSPISRRLLPRIASNWPRSRSPIRAPARLRDHLVKRRLLGRDA